MPKGPSPSKQDGQPFGVERTVKGVNGEPVYGTDGKLLKERVRMADATCSNGQPQSLYFPGGHTRAGHFTNAPKLRWECPQFHCPKGATACCCQRILYTQPDFDQVESQDPLQIPWLFRLFYFLPKFHCELNFIKQCWGHAKLAQPNILIRRNPQTKCYCSS